jgi:hypothetical protein
LILRTLGLAVLKMTLDCQSCKTWATNKLKAVLEEDMKMNSPQKTARVAAFVFLIIFFLGMSTELFIRPGMIVPGDAAATVRNIAASEALFRLSLVSDLIRQALLMALTLILYKLLKPVNKTIAALMVIFYLVCVPVSMLNELNHFAVLLLSSGAGFTAAFKTDQLNALVMFFLDLRTYGTFIAQFFPSGYCSLVIWFSNRVSFPEF